MFRHGGIQITGHGRGEAEHPAASGGDPFAVGAGQAQAGIAAAGNGQGTEDLHLLAADDVDVPVRAVVTHPRQDPGIVHTGGRDDVCGQVSGRQR